MVSHWAGEGWNLVVAISGRARDDRTIEWVRAHVDALRILGVLLAALLVVVLPVGWIAFLVIVVLLAGYEWWLYRVKHSTLTPDPASGTEPPDMQPPAPSASGSAQAV